MPKYPLDINPTSDTFIQYLFALKEHEPFLLSFVNAVLADANRPLAVELSVQSPINLERFATEKRSIVDIKALDETGRTVEIEVQTINHPSFVNRTLYYACRNYSDQLDKSEDYDLLRPVVSIAVTRFNLFPRKRKMHNVFFLREVDEDSDDILTDHLELHFLELTRWKLPQFPQNSTELRSWLDFFFYANRRTEDEMNVLLDPATLVRNAYDEYCDFCQTPEMRAIALQEEKEARDYRSIISEKVAEARVRGEARGEARGKMETLFRFLNRRFTIPEVDEVEPVIRKITSPDELDRLFELAMDVVLFEDFKNGL